MCVQRGSNVACSPYSMATMLQFHICLARWMNVGAVKGGSTEYCAAGSQHFGPCSNELVAFAGMSTDAKRRWSQSCQVRFAMPRETQRSTGTYISARLCILTGILSLQTSHIRKSFWQNVHVCKCWSLCSGCQRDFGKPCPQGWTQTGTERKCSPGPNYEGPCR